MKNTAGVFGAVLVVVAMVFSFTQGAKGQAQSLEIGRYQLTPVDELSFIVWKLDTATGDLWRCQAPTGATNFPRTCGDPLQ